MEFSICCINRIICILEWIIRFYSCWYVCSNLCCSSISTCFTNVPYPLNPLSCLFLFSIHGIFKIIPCINFKSCWIFHSLWDLIYPPFVNIRYRHLYQIRTPSISASCYRLMIISYSNVKLKVIFKRNFILLIVMLPVNSFFSNTFIIETSDFRYLLDPLDCFVYQHFRNLQNVLYLEL